MPNEKTDRFTTEEGLIVRESPADDGSILVEEVGFFEYVIYRYHRRPFDDSNPIFEDMVNWLEKLGKEKVEQLRAEVKKHAEEGEKKGTNEIPVTSPIYLTDERDTGPVFLCERITGLDRRCEEMKKANPLSIDLARWRRNRKLAKRRLRRWIKGNDDQLVEIPEPYRDLVKRVIKEGTKEKNDVWNKDWCEQMIWGEGYIDVLRDYWQRKAERVILVVSEIPDQIRSVLYEATEAYYYGLFRATTAICRAVLDDLVHRVVEVQGAPIPIKNILDKWIDSVPQCFLPLDEREAAQRIRKLGNKALHDPNAIFLDEDVWCVLTETCGLVERMINRGGLVSDKGQ